MTALKPDTRKITPEEYLEEEIERETRHEFVDGIAYAMAGTTDWHGLVAMALGSSLYARLPHCQTFMTDMKVRIDEGSSITYYYPDVLVSCAEVDRAKYFREQPVLIIEVLSPSTERIDRGEKFAAYKKIASLQEYVLAAQDVPIVEVYRRRAGWQGEVYLPGSTFTLDSVDLEFAVNDIYRRLPFGMPA